MCDWVSISLGILSVLLGGLALYIALRIVNIGNRSAYSKIYMNIGTIRFKMFTLELVYSGSTEEEKVRQDIFNEVMKLNIMIISLKGESTLPAGYKNNKKFTRLLNTSTKVSEFIDFFDNFSIDLLNANKMKIISKYNDLNEYKVKYRRNWYCMIVGFTETLKDN